MNPTPFRIDIPQPVLDDLLERLGRTRWPDEVEGAGWDYGTNLAFMRRLVEHWRTGFDWRAQEKALNVFPHFRAVLDGHDVHFIHVKGRGARPIPLLLANGWPSNFVELLPLVPFLTDEKDGVSFELVIPSLPGYGFSGKPTQRGANLSTTANAWVKLMEGLGHGRFFAHGSDLGAGVLERMRANHSQRLLGIHFSNLYWGYPQPPNPTEAEKRYFEAMQFWTHQEGAYAMVQSTKPQTLAFGLTDSPVGMAAWIVEKFRTWSDCDGDVEKAYSLDTLCTLLTVYWATETIGSSMRLYYEAFRDPGMKKPIPRGEVPVGAAVFPKDINPAPREWGERWLNLRHYTKMPRGGHFPGLEAPELLADDVRAFARELRSR